MKMKVALLPLLLAGLMSVPVLAQDEEVKMIDDAARNQSEERILDRLSGQLGMPAATLEQQKQQHKLSYGELFMANSLAKASGRSFDMIVSDFRSGKGWGKIAQENNVRLGAIVSDARRAGQKLRSEEGKVGAGKKGKVEQKTGHKEMKTHQKQEREEMKAHQKQERDELKTRQKSEREAMKQQKSMPRREPSSPPDRGRGKGRGY